MHKHDGVDWTNHPHHTPSPSDVLQLTAGLKSSELATRQPTGSTSTVMRSQWTCCVRELLTSHKSTRRTLRCDHWAAVSITISLQSVRSLLIMVEMCFDFKQIHMCEALELNVACVLQVWSWSALTRSSALRCTNATQQATTAASRPPPPGWSRQKPPASWRRKWKRNWTGPSNKLLRYRTNLSSAMLDRLMREEHESESNRTGGFQMRGC